MCYGCTTLQTVPWLNIEGVTVLIYVFYGCTSPTADSLLPVLNALAYLTESGLIKRIHLATRNTNKLIASARHCNG